jgi:hypothetical protein
MLQVTKANLKFPRFQLGYATHIGRGASMHAGVGASQRIYSASFALETDKQDYDLQAIIYSASLVRLHLLFITRSVTPLSQYKTSIIRHQVRRGDFLGELLLEHCG